MIIKKDEINREAECYHNSVSWKAGVEWAESKLKEIAIEFGKFAYEHYEDSYLSFEELFQLFIKKRNEK